VELKEIKLKPRYEFKVPVFGRCISPDNFAGKSISEIKKMEIYEGNTVRALEDLFIIDGEVCKARSETQITIDGNVAKLSWVGCDMSDGRIVVKGDVGHYTANRMLSGTVKVYGNAGSRLGAKMKGGYIEVYGNAGSHVGSYYRGEHWGMGMKGGRITIHGDAGAEVGAGMKKGTIIIDGSVGSLPGIDMTGGVISIKGSCEGRPGARMRGGKVVIIGQVPAVLPSFYIDSIVDYVKVDREEIAGPFYLFIGDVLGHMKCHGRLFISIKNNPHLKLYEQFLS